MQSILSNAINSIAALFCIKTEAYTSQKESRTNYVDKLKILIINLSTENYLKEELAPLETDIDNKPTLEMAINDGLVLFKPRNVNSVKSLKYLLDDLASYEIDNSESNSLG